MGTYICRQIIERPGIRSLAVEVSLENYVGKIRSMRPAEIMIIDCMELGKEAGSTCLLEINELEDITFNTHNISLGSWKDFFPFPARVLGIQPMELGFGEHLSRPVLHEAHRIIGLINTFDRN